MDFSSNPVHEEIRKVVREVCSKFPDDYWMEHDDSKEFPWDFYNAIVDGGWLGLTVPIEYGGAGLGVTEAAIVEQEIAASGAGMNGCSAVHIGIFGFEPIIRHGSEELKRRFLPRLVTGGNVVRYCRRDPQKGLSGSLWDALKPAGEQTALNEGWRAAEARLRDITCASAR